jgi:integrase/recombinase XerC
MASVFKRGRWVDEAGRKCTKSVPGARYAESRFYSIQYVLDGQTKIVKGYTDRQATEQLAAKLERAKAQRAEGLEDPYKAHRKRPLAEHVGDWIAELRQRGRDDVYVRACEARMTRLIAECGWSTLGAINLESFLRWRQTATSTVGTSAKPGANVQPMSAKTRNHYLAAGQAFCRWAVRRKRTDVQPLSDVSPVSTAGQLRRERRSLTEVEVGRLLAVVPARHQLHYRTILLTGLRRDELRQLRWGDVRLDGNAPSIQLRAETTKGKRADVLPLRRDVADLMAAARNKAGDDERVFKSLPSMESHKRYLTRADIPFEDGMGRRVDFHALRHTFGSMLAKGKCLPLSTPKLP